MGNSPDQLLQISAGIGFDKTLCCEKVVGSKNFSEACFARLVRKRFQEEPLLGSCFATSWQKALFSRPVAPSLFRRYRFWKNHRAKNVADAECSMGSFSGPILQKAIFQASLSNHFCADLGFDNTSRLQNGCRCKTLSESYLNPNLAGTVFFCSVAVLLFCRQRPALVLNRPMSAQNDFFDAPVVSLCYGSAAGPKPDLRGRISSLLLAAFTKP